MLGVFPLFVLPGGYTNITNTKYLFFACVTVVFGIAKLIVEEKKVHPNRTVSYLAKKYGIAHTTVQRWLKNSAALCNYNPNEEQSKGNSMPIYCTELNEAFLNAKCAFEKYGIHRSSIYDCINGKRRYKSAGKHPVTGEPLHWKRISLGQYEEWCKSNQQTTQN